MSRLLKCTCVNAMMDKVHGKGMRPHSGRPTGGPEEGKNGWRCSVCGNIQQVGSTAKAAKAEKKKDQQTKKK